MIPGDSFLHITGQTAVALLLAAMALVLWRLAKGPTAADRVIALDLLSMLVVAFLVAVSILARETSYLDVAIAFTCIAFLGTIALARFILRASQKQPDRKQGKTVDG
jgi:multicomponent Na+:H+ antiporter subunit F